MHKYSSRTTSRCPAHQEQNFRWVMGTLFVSRMDSNVNPL